MTVSVRSITFYGIEARTIEVQVQIASGMPSFNIVGLPDKAVSEAKERVKSALHAIGLSLPPKRITVNLAPADVLKEGSHFDLAIAIGLLSGMEVIPQDIVDEYLVMGELSLDARIRAVAGVLPAAVHAQSEGVGIICPAECGPEAAWIESIKILAPSTLLSLISHVKGESQLKEPQAPSLIDQNTQGIGDLADIRGQETAKRALEIAAAGGHNMLLMGPPGAGKSMMASRLPTILPPLSPQEALEISMLHSVAGILKGGKILRDRPYRAPHHSASLPALVGGGHRAKPGEISLAHRGVLFLDELPEFRRDTLEALRQPLETGDTLISRANYHVTYPAQFQLIAAMKPCRCGHLGDPAQACNRAPKCGSDYQARLSGPLLDQIDLFVTVPAVPLRDMDMPKSGETSAVVRSRVEKARHQQLSRSNKINARLGGDDLEKVCSLPQEDRQFLLHVAEKLNLSARAYHRVLRVARTIADLACQDKVQRGHLAEALSFRRSA